MEVDPVEEIAHQLRGHPKESLKGSEKDALHGLYKQVWQYGGLFTRKDSPFNALWRLGYLR